MLRGSFQHAAMATLLMGLMIVPLGTCLERSPNGAHSCCMELGSSHSLRTDCCVVRPELPAILVAPTLLSASPSETAHDFVVCVEQAASDERATRAVNPPLSPPTGAFILRI